MDEFRIRIREFFGDLTFEDKEHKYFVKGVPIDLSVSGKIKDFFTPFNKHEKSIGTANSRGISQKEVLAEWDEARDKSLLIGNSAHLFGELFAFNRQLRPQSGYEIAIMKFWGDLPPHIIPVMVEVQMYHKGKYYAGTMDILLYNTQSEKFIIGDYKTNKDLFKNYKGQKMLGPFSHLLDNPFNHYQIQLSYYQILFEQLGYEVSYRKVIWVKPDGTYAIYDCEDLTEHLR